MKIEIGQQAPDFTLYDSEKNKITLSDLKGQNVLLLFFPTNYNYKLITSYYEWSFEMGNNQTSERNYR